ncbi:MAG: DUF5011 domain-containing protein [Lachnospiraceae bacterium]|nr:DUF5011 domain-containing protein [Lachnospiraceae bacterium]
MWLKKQYLLLFFLLCVFLTACNGEEVGESTTDVDSKADVDITTQVPMPTETPIPTQAPTPQPTETPIPEPADTQPPVLEGVQNITIYLGEPVIYRKGIVLTDDSGETPDLKIDTSQVDLTTAGTYSVIYQATDSAGNVTTEEIVLEILEKPTVEEVAVKELADQLIADLVTEEMSDFDKAYVLWNWCRRNIRYAYVPGDRTSIWTGAYEGLHDQKGDCYAYYAAYAVLLDRLGIENMCVERVGGDSNHWWNLVNLGEGWYHCDPSPRSNGDRYRCFMQTDEQIQAYTEANTRKPDYYTFDATLYPERATEIIHGDNPEKIKAARQRVESMPPTTPEPVILPETMTSDAEKMLSTDNMTEQPQN